MGMNKKAAEALATQQGLTAGRVKGLTNELIALGKQNPKPKADVEITPAQRKIKTLQAQIKAIKQGSSIPGINLNTAAGRARIRALQDEIDALRGKNIVVTTTLFGQRVAGGAGGQGGITRSDGGPITGVGGPTQDNIPLWGSVGEFMVNAKSYAKHRPLVQAINADKLAAGGPVGNINVSLPRASAIQAALNAAPDMFGGAAFSGMAGSGVQRWLPVVLQALAMTGQSAGMAQTLLRRMNQESGGDPNIVNRWDSNWLAGTPSKGLLQTIDPTFQAYRSKSLPNNVFHPLANIVASINYALARYGSLPAAYNRPGGYAQGTDNAAPGWAMVGELGPEMVRFSGGEQVTPAHKLAAGGFVSADFSGITGRIPGNAPTGADVAAARLRQASATKALLAAEDALEKLRRTKGHTAKQVAAAEDRLTNSRGVLRAVTTALRGVEIARNAAARPLATQFHVAAQASSSASGLFLKNIDLLNRRGYHVLADQLLTQGDSTAMSLANAAVKSTRTARTLTSDVATSARIQAGLDARRAALEARNPEVCPRRSTAQGRRPGGFRTSSSKLGIPS